MLNLGTVRPGTTIYVPFDSFKAADGSSITASNFAAADIEIYKDGSMTQRGSDSGYTLLDTDGIDLDGTTGIHGISIDLADNTTAGFYAAGSRYWVVIGPITVDGQTINFLAARFDIGYPDAVINTTIATLASQTSFTLTAGPAEDDAINGCVVCIHDVASAVQLGFAVVSDYSGSSKTVTLAAGTTFAAAAGDNISVFLPVSAQWLGAPAVASINAEADVALSDIHLDHLLAVDYDPASKPGNATALLNELVESDAGVSRFTANTLEQGPVGTGTSTLSAQDVRDAMMLAPTAGSPAAGSIDKHLDDIPTTAAPSAAEIADAVLDEEQGTHTGYLASVYTGTPPAASEIAGAVLDEVGGTHSGWLMTLAQAGADGDDLKTISDQLDLAAQTGSDGDTLETLSGQLDALAAAGAGAGSSTLVYTVTDERTGLPVADVRVWATTDAPGANVVAGGRTSTLGVVTLWLDPGTYYIWRRKAGYTFENPDSEVVA